MRASSESGSTFGKPSPARNSTRRVRSLALDASLPASCFFSVDFSMPSWVPIPPGSRMRTTEPSPRMVWPEKIFKCASEALSGLTTISCTSSTASTRVPKNSAPMRMMTTSCSSEVLAHRGFDAEDRAEIDDRYDLVAQFQNQRVLYLFDDMAGVGAQTDRLDHRMLRQRETLVADPHDQRRRDGQRQRNFQREAAASSGRGGQRDRPADRTRCSSGRRPCRRRVRRRSSPWRRSKNRARR